MSLLSVRTGNEPSNARVASRVAYSWLKVVGPKPYWPYRLHRPWCVHVCVCVVCVRVCVRVCVLTQLCDCSCVPAMSCSCHYNVPISLLQSLLLCARVPQLLLVV